MPALAESMPSRRFFLKSLVGASVAYCFMPSIPLIGEGVSAYGPALGTLVTPDWVVMEAARSYLNTVNFVTQIKRTYDPNRIDVLYGAKVKIRRSQ